MRSRMLERGRASCRRHRTRIRADQICDPPAGQPGPPGQHRLSAQASGRTTRAPCAPVSCELQLSGSWSQPRRVIAKVEWHPEELYPRVGFIVTNMRRPAERVVAFYNKRGTCEQWVKEGKGAIKWTRLSCRTFAGSRAAPTSCARLQSRQF